jgi:protein involved in polysaccharide export with SLBB domain
MLGHALKYRSHLSAPAAAALLLLLGAPAAPLAAQQTAADSALQRLTISRDSLQAALATLGVVADAESSATGRDRAKTVADAIRARLERGDFQAGDRILLQVDSEPQLSDTFPVGPNQELVLPVVGVISLHGVLRSELQAAMTRELGRFLRDPIVRALPLIRIAVVGEVTKPGFYLLPPTYVVSDVITAGGGPTQDAKVDQMRVERGGRRLLEGEALQQLIAEGRTLDDAGIRPGDKFVIPAISRGRALDTVRIVSIVLSIPLTIYALIQVFKK